MSEINDSMDLSSPIPGSPSASNSLGESLSPPFPSPSPSNGSRRLYIPPELLRDIFAAIRRHPSRARDSTLASLCLVNRTCLAIARPLLYRDIRLDLSIPYRMNGTSDRDASGTLIESEECAQLVKTVTIWHRRATNPDPVALAYVLSHLENVEALKPVRNPPALNHDIVAECLKAVVRHCPKLRHLELPSSGVIRARDFELRFSATHHLESFEGHLVPLHPPFSAVQSRTPSPTSPPPFHLKRLVVHTCQDRPIFDRLIASSYDSLTTLSLRAGGGRGHVVDLSQLHNLSSLHLTSSPSEGYLAPGMTDFSKPGACLDLRRILESTRNLRITKFSLMAKITPSRYRVRHTPGPQPTCHGLQLDAIIILANQSPCARLGPQRPYVRQAEYSGEEWPWSELNAEAQVIRKLGGLDIVKVVKEAGCDVGFSWGRSSDHEMGARIGEDEESETDEDSAGGSDDSDSG